MLKFLKNAYNAVKSFFKSIFRCLFCCFPSRRKVNTNAFKTGLSPEKTVTKDAFKTEKKDTEKPTDLILNGSTSSIYSQVSEEVTQVSDATTESSVKSSNKKEETTSQINSSITSESSVKDENNLDDTSIVSEVTEESDAEPEDFIKEIDPERKKILQQEENLLNQGKPPNGGISFLSNFKERKKQKKPDKDGFTDIWLEKNFKEDYKKEGYKSSSEEEDEESGEDNLDKIYREKHKDPRKSTAKITKALQHNNNNIKSQQRLIQQNSPKQLERKSKNFFTKLLNFFRKKPRTSCNPKIHQQKSQSPVLVK